MSRSFGALGNAQKRAEYDRYGSTEEQQGLRQRRPGGGGGFREEDIDPFEVFNMFFGGAGPMGGMGPGVRFHYAVRTLHCPAAAYESYRLWLPSPHLTFHPSPSLAMGHASRCEKLWVLLLLKPAWTRWRVAGGR